MHEISLAAGVLSLVEDCARREPFARLIELRLEVGRLAGVDVHALRFALDSLAAGTVLDGANIRIDEPVGTARCVTCGQTVGLAHRGDPCPACGGYGLSLLSGTELRVVDLTVADEATPAGGT
jgi:hydrogenase nickel incorporation protein HypA/HybF